MARTKQLDMLSTGGRAPLKNTAAKAARMSKEADAEAHSKLFPHVRAFRGRDGAQLKVKGKVGSFKR